MNAHEAQAWNRIGHQLAGSIILEASELEDDVTLLVEAAAIATGMSGTLDVEAILETLAQVGQRHCDAGHYAEDYEDDDPGWRPVETAPISGEIL